MAGLYLHIPFCKQKCSYCDFHFSTTFDSYRSTMIEALCKEMILRSDYLGKSTMETFYFGGGTPSLLTNEELEQLISTAYHCFNFKEEIEFTLEANPDDIDTNSLSYWKSLGVNRLSIGIQSFFQEDLDWMNRAHDVDEAKKALRLAKEYQFSITADLIYGLPNRSLDDWKANINQLLMYQPEHISAYCLTVEKKTALYKMIHEGKLPSVEEDNQAEQFLLLKHHLEENGYQQYEISNFAKEEAYSRHNSSYWRGVPYIGIGPSAHSYDGSSRQWNVANNRKYMKSVLKGMPYFEQEVLTSQNRFNELLLTGLRTKWGVNLDELKEIFPFSEDFMIQLNRFKEQKLLFEEENTLVLTENGKLQADYIASSLFTE